jgi:hypothetical protein
MFAIPWFLTYMATKIPQLEVLLEFWELTVQKNDPPFFFYVLVAFLMQNSVKIRSADAAKLPVVMTNLRITSSKELESIFTLAE